MTLQLFDGFVTTFSKTTMKQRDPCNATLVYRKRKNMNIGICDFLQNLLYRTYAAFALNSVN